MLLAKNGRTTTVRARDAFFSIASSLPRTPSSLRYYSRRLCNSPNTAGQTLWLALDAAGAIAWLRPRHLLLFSTDFPGAAL